MHAKTSCIRVFLNIRNLSGRVHSLQMLQQPHKELSSDNIHSSGYCKNIFLINVELDKKILSLILKESNFLYDSDCGYTFTYDCSGVIG